MWPPEGTEPDSTCGLASPTYPPRTFLNENDYDWAIALPDAWSDSLTIAYYLTPMDSLHHVTGILELRSVVVADSVGDLDTLSVVGQAVINPDLLITGVSPSVLQPGTTTCLTISGNDLRDSSTIVLRQGSRELPARGFRAGSSGYLLAQVTPGAAPRGAYDLELASPDGRTASLPGAVDVEDASFSGNRFYPSDRLQPVFTFPPLGHVDGFSFYNTVSLPPCYPPALGGQNIVTRAPGDTVTRIWCDLYPYVVGVYSSSPGTKLGFLQYNAGTRPYSSVGLLASGSSAHSSDAGAAYLKVVAHYTDGDSASEDLHLGRQIRNYCTGGDGCSSFLTSGPTDPLCGQVYSGAYQDQTYFLDVQECVMPESLRAVPIDYIQLRQAFDPTCAFPAWSFIYGWALWNHFRVRSAAGDTVRLQTQYYAAWGDSAYGAYRYGSQVVGTKATIGQLGCLLACCAMVNEFYGTSCTPLQLNRYLQERHGGYGRRGEADSLVVHGDGSLGDTVTFAWRYPKSTHGSLFLIEPANRSWYPIATVRVLGNPKTSQTGVIETLYDHGHPISGQTGYTYSDVTVPVASLWSGGWHPIASIRTAARVESSLAVNQPVILHTNFGSSGPTHFLLADGREAAYVSNAADVGTYHIADPGWSQSRLSVRRFGNAYLQPRACVSGGGGGHQRLLSADAPVLAMTLQGPGHAEVVTPSGVHVTYDAVVDDYVVDSETVDAWRNVAIEDPADSTLEGARCDYVVFTEPEEGLYRVSLTNDSDGEVTLQMTGTLGDGDAPSAYMLGSGGAGGTRSYYVSYTRAEGVGSWGVAEVQQSVPRRNSIISAGPNPMGRTLRLRVGLAKGGQVEAGVFDVSGRRVGGVPRGFLPAGVHDLTWDARRGDGGAVSPGVYFVRLSCEGWTETRRVVVLQ